jgi:hypothetical protein
MRMGAWAVIGSWPDFSRIPPTGTVQLVDRVSWRDLLGWAIISAYSTTDSTVATRCKSPVVLLGIGGEQPCNKLAPCAIQFVTVVGAVRRKQFMMGEQITDGGLLLPNRKPHHSVPLALAAAP